MESTIDTDYLVVGAGAAGMAFTDALLDHSAASVTLVDRRHGVGGHWLDAYPFVRLHQASAFYGVASTQLGTGALQVRGPEAGLHERAYAPEICAYYNRLLTGRFAASGRFEFLGNCEYSPAAGVRSLVSGKLYRVPARCRIVDARYLSPDIPSRSPAPFEIEDGAEVVPVNELVRIRHAYSQFVIAGSGKTASDACLFLLANGVDPDAIVWVRPRDPWLLNRAVVQPVPSIFLTMVAAIMELATEAHSLDDLFLRMEQDGIMLRIDPGETPTMAKTPTLAQWELNQLRTVRHVVRLGHIHRVVRGRLFLDHESVAISPDTLTVHCAASGLKYPPQKPIWGPAVITLQPIRAGFPCFGAALAGYVESSRRDDEEKNRLCPSTPYPDSLRQWVAMTYLGALASKSFNSAPDIKEWSNSTTLNPARLPPENALDEDMLQALDRLQRATAPGLAALAAMM